MAVSPPPKAPVKDFSSLKIAIVADWLTTYAGAERVVEQMLHCFPQADVFALVDTVPESERAFLQGKKVHTSFLQGWPNFLRKRFRQFIPVLPVAVESLDVSAYDVVLSSSHCVAKGILTGPHQLHVSYVHSPVRYAWDLQHEYLQNAGLKKGIKRQIALWMLHGLRIWDMRTVPGVDYYIANSDFIRRRIRKVYGKESDIIYPPANLDKFSLTAQKEDFYVTASRMVPYKRIDLIVETFTTLPDKKLVVIGDGAEYERIKTKALGHDNITFLGYQPDNILRDYMSRAKAFVFAALEDFGIIPVEAQACGTPVIAYGAGGALETVKHGVSGILYPEQSVAALRKAILDFEHRESPIRPEDCRQNAESFSIDAFRTNLTAYVRDKWAEFSARS
jgi:glycosyltransferase involved in cell wall biosynthesis